MKKFSILSVTMFFCVLTSYPQPGSLDLSFGPGGKVITNIVDRNQSNDIIYAIAIQSDGKIVVAGTSSLPDYPQSAVPSMIMRYYPDGTPDNSFDYDGTYLRYGIKFAALAIQPDGKILAAGSNFSLIRLNSNGSVDNSFGVNGTISITIGSGNTVTAMALQADGKIVLAGYYFDGAYNRFALARFTNNGSPDNGFDGDGALTTDFGPYEEVINGMAIQSDGKILVNGYASDGATMSFAVARYNDNGGLDNSFDGDGKLTISFGAGTNNYGSSIVAQADGNVLITGHSDNNLAIARYTTTGSPDNSFDGDGKLVTVAASGFNRATPTAVLPNGKILVATYNSNDFGVFRYLSDGSPDNSFDGDGKLTTDLSADGDYPTCMAVRNDGTVLVGGYSLNPDNRDFSIAAYQDNGSLDNSFNGNGKLINVWGANFDIASAIAIQNDGKIILGGSTAREDISSSHDIALARYNTNGTLDNTFDGDGRVALDVVGSDTKIFALAIQTDGKIIAGGVGRFNSSTYDVLVLRFNSNGTIDNTFDGDGAFFVSVTSGNDGVHSIVIQSDGKILLAGSGLLIRLNSNGSLDNSFDGDGIAITALAGTVSVALQNDGKILLGGAYNSDFAIVRYNTNGAIDNSFDGDGMVTTDFGTNEGITSIKIQSDGKIIAGGIAGNSFALARYNSNGIPDNTFDGDGKQTTDLTAIGTALQAFSLDIQSNGKIVMSGQIRIGTEDFLLARYNTDGSPDNSFDSDGIATLDLGPGSSDRMSEMAIASNRIYMAGWVLTPGGFDFLLAAVVADPLLGPLPLQLRDFSGKRVNDDALLTWKTELESNMLEYIVERSVDGRNYSDVGTVSAVNRTEIHNYYLTDYNITSLNVPVVYYRLRQKGIDGKHNYSRIIALALDKDKQIVMFYPNPVINEANVALTVSRPDKLQVRILDNVGRMVRRQPWNVSAGSTSLSIDVSNLAKGMYYLEIKGENVDYKKQFVK